MYFFRPHLLLPIWTPALLGYHRAGEIGFPFILILLLFFLGGFIYGINQIFDREADIINKKNLSLSTEFFSIKTAWITTILSGIASLLISFFLHPLLFILTLTGLILGILYSAYPFRFSDRPLLSIILNGVGHGILIFIIGYSFTNSKEMVTSLLPALSYFFAYSSVYVFTTIPDIKGDLKEKKRTVSVILGRKIAGYIGIVLIFVAAGTGIIFKEFPVVITSLIVLPFYVISTLKESDKWIVNTNKLAVLTLTLITCYYFPLYIPFIIVAITISFLFNIMVKGERYP